MAYPGAVKFITVAELRQNPTRALREVESGLTYVVTRHRREIARLVPPAESPDIVPARNSSGARLRSRHRPRLRTASSIGELLADMESAW